MGLQKDIDFEFVGFGGTDGRCHIRIVQAEEKAPLVIVCSQYRNYFGTSVTNGFELIVAKLFRDIAEHRIDGLSFDNKQPFFEDDRSAHSVFESLVNLIMPKRYRSSSVAKLDIVRLFSSVIWIEHYPKGTGISSTAATTSVVTLDRDGRPVWQYGLSNDVLQASGLNRKQLLVESSEVSSEPPKAILGIAVDADTDNPIEPDTHVAGFRQVRWITHLLESLPTKIKDERFKIGDNADAPFDEKYVHNLMLQILVISLPASDLVQRDYQIGKTLNLYKGGRQKECDFVIFHPEGIRPYAVLEVKRTLAKSGTLHSEVVHDLARLALCSHVLGSYAYQVVVGDLTQIRDQLSDLLPCKYDPDAQTLKITVANLKLDNEYRTALSQAGITILYVKTQGVSDEKASSVLLWEVSHDPARLGNQRPYRFQLLSVA